MKETKRIKVSKPLIIVLLLAMLVVSSCKPKATHLTQSLQNSRIPGQSSTQTPVVSSQSTPVQPPTSVNEPTATSIEPLGTYPASLTSTPEQASASAPIVLTPTSTQKSATPQVGISTLTPTQTRTATPTLIAIATPTLTATATPTKTATLTQTPTMQTGWAGEWRIFWQLENQAYIEGTILIETIGTDFTASGTWGGVVYSFTGRIIDQGLTAFGNWTSPTSTGNFVWNAVNDGQFGGSRDLFFGNCGAREGVNPPEPCYIPPLS